MFKNKSFIIIAVLIILVSIVIIFYFYKFRSKPTYVPKKDGIINTYNSLPNAFEKKKLLFESGAIEEVAGSFGIIEGNYFKINKNGEGWGFIKNRSTIMWDGTEGGTIDMYQYSVPLHTYNANYSLSLYSCFLGFPVSLDTKQGKDLGDNTLGDKSSSYIVVHIPNEIVAKGDIQDLMTVVTVVNHAMMVGSPAIYGEFASVHDTIPYVQDRIDFEEGKNKTEENRFNAKIKNSKVMGDTYLRWLSYVKGDPMSKDNSLNQCVEAKMKAGGFVW